MYYWVISCICTNIHVLRTIVTFKEIITFYIYNVHKLRSILNTVNIYIGYLLNGCIECDFILYWVNQEKFEDTKGGNKKLSINTCDKVKPQIFFVFAHDEIMTCIYFY
jgi:hypothetical protein